MDMNLDEMMKPEPASPEAVARVKQVIATAKHDKTDVLAALRETRDRAVRRGDYDLANAANEQVKILRKKK